MINPIPKLQNQPKKAPPKRKEEMINPTLQGVLVDTHIKTGGRFIDFDDTCNILMISPDSVATYKIPAEKPQKQSFDMKKALLPLAVGTIVTALGVAVLSIIFRKSYKAGLDKKLEKLPALARNNNLSEETEFATYNILRDPSPTNILGAAAVFLYSGLTLAAKNFTDGVKEIWIKKREADIERDLQENLIAVETKSFSGKLGEINGLLNENIKYFKKTLNPEQAVFGKPFTFKGDSTEEKNEAQPPKKNKDLPLILGALGVVGALILGGATVFKNVKKSSKVLTDFFVDADKTMGGITNKTQYYSYMNENRGHLYNWFINPQNEFMKYIFLSFSSISAVGYVFKQGLDAVKSVTVSRENSKTELGLKKRLVDVEIANFRAKKNAAITPLLDNFNYQVKQGKPREELKCLAENILFEIKGGPPYVYS